MNDVADRMSEHEIRPPSAMRFKRTLDSWSRIEDVRRLIASLEGGATLPALTDDQVASLAQRMTVARGEELEVLVRCQALLAERVAAPATPDEIDAVFDSMFSTHSGDGRSWS